MKTYYRSFIAGFAFVLISTSCSETFLEKRPYGTISEAALSNAAGVDALLVGAYSLLDGGGAVGGGYTSGWTVLLAPDDARIGTESGANAINTFLIDASMSQFNDRWRFLYSAVQRCNDVLKLLPKAPDLKPEDAIQIEAEAKFLRGHYYFTLAALWKNVPWIDETIDYSLNNY
ncbi:MAG TPA: RagB/SusD family nutrient uptake outer membrane protein, partial [Chryseosolibacter sp.]|nr:RagB/SusD family nutrient uptake outer membrane protein [Chryseosolibacter sp.]